MRDLEIITNDHFISIKLPSNEKYISYKYEIYGNLKFFNSGLIEFVGGESNFPFITFNLNNLSDDIFFIKILAKKETMTENDLYFSFYDHEKNNTKKNLIMEITEPNLISLCPTTIYTQDTSPEPTSSEDGDGDGNISDSISNKTEETEGSDNGEV
jgi:hypothetical protein